MLTLTWDEVTSRRLASTSLAEPAPAGDMLAVASAVCGLQAQVLSAAELGLGARVAGLTQAGVEAELWEHRRLVKTYSLRGTLHIHPARELPLWTAARRAIPAWSDARRAELYGLEPAQVAAVEQGIADALDGRALTRAELAADVARRAGEWARERLASTWADLISIGVDAGLLCFGPSQGSQVTFVRPDQWLGFWQELDPDESLAEVFRRYLAAYGPATHQDFARWFAAGHFKPAESQRLVDSMTGELEPVTVAGQRGWLLAETAAMRWEPVRGTLRLLPQYDSYVLGCRFGREHIVPESARARVFAFKNGRFEGATGLPVLLIDGVVAGMWERVKSGKRLQVRVEPFVRLSVAQRKQLEREAARVGRFFGMEAELVMVEFG